MRNHLSALEAAVSPGGMLTGSDIGPRYHTDTFGRSVPAPEAVLRPASTDELSRALKICHACGLAVVPQGGMTGLVSAALPRSGEIVVSLERMNRILEVDRAAATMVVEAGAILQNVQERADAEGLMFPLDLGSRGSATIGGNIATNAGGNMVIRYGMTRGLVLGIEAVTANGDVVDSTFHYVKNNTGYDVKQFFIGSEGTLGIVTRAVLQLWPRPAERAVAFCSLASFADVVSLLNQLRTSLEGRLVAFEAMWESYYGIAAALPGIRLPLSAGKPFYVLVEAASASQGEVVPLLESALGNALAEGTIDDAVLAKSETEARSMWHVRESALEVLGLKRPFLAFDVSLRLDRMEGYLADVQRQAALICADAFVSTLGHLGDGNLHVGIQYPGSDPHMPDRLKATFYRVTGDHGGSISAEHGIGIDKRAYLHYSRSKSELALMKAVKLAFDPKNILSPGRIFDLGEN
jgi:FAD/FMN-containing dehydrogenase